ncbi:hypothetical protein NQ318_016688 [Aromia moschata]|uniref:Uncharacterized protein n=1 Tax=Aromia moschata TaxID=1265417 RepID=A0AAV8Y2D7_9CUCU|nr:hypothetical protein NQ318_016688 [Aromia moschata]
MFQLHYGIVYGTFMTGHLPIVVINYDDEYNLVGRWIGRGNDSPINWPSRSPDLNSADFYLWGDIKSIVYSSSVNSEELRQRIVEAFNAVRNNPDNARPLSNKP